MAGDRLQRRLAATLAAVLLAVGSADAAEMVVLASTAPDLAPGTLIAEGERLELPDGATVTLMTESSRSLTLHGPYAGVPALGPERGDDPGMMAVLANLLNEEGGTAALGGIRALGEPTRADGIDVTRSGTYCVAVAAARLWRPSAETAMSVRLTDLASATTAAVSWRAGESVRPWPSDLGITDLASFLALRDGAREPVTLELRVMPESFADDGKRIAWLAGRGCIGQARTQLAALRDRVAPLAVYLSTDRGRAPVYSVGESMTLLVRTNRGAAL